ncbi:MAG: anhydro-N-acetylmuramic acid kinase [Chitinophagaceae bacterium]|nr:anhydro-N-acetylmuramic acid kinase [Chitinophagaceae bacterium]
MVYRVLALVDSWKRELVAGFVQLEVSGKNWSYELKATARFEYDQHLKERISKGDGWSAAEYLQLHSDYGKLLAGCSNQFIRDKELQYQIQLIASPGLPLINNSAYTLGDGAAIAAITGINTVSDFKVMDAALGGSNQQLAYQTILPVTNADEIELVHTAFFAVLRWREENNMMAGQTGAGRDSIGGAVWIGQEW